MVGLAGEASDPEAEGEETGDEALTGPFDGELLTSVHTARVLALVIGCGSLSAVGERCALLSESAAKGDLWGSKGSSVSIAKGGEGDPDDSLQGVRTRANRAGSPALFSSALTVISLPAMLELLLLFRTRGLGTVAGIATSIIALCLSG